MKVLAISGSLRAGSYNEELLGAAVEHLPSGWEVERWDGLRDIPAYDQDLDKHHPPNVLALREAIEAADAVLIATPEYNHSIPGALKNALDWVSRPHATNPLRNKPVAVIGASASAFGAIWAQAELRKVMGAIGARVVGEDEIPVANAADAFTADGRLVEPELDDAVAALIAALTDSVSERMLIAA